MIRGYYGWKENATAVASREKVMSMAREIDKLNPGRLKNANVCDHYSPNFNRMGCKICQAFAPHDCNSCEAFVSEHRHADMNVT